MEAEKATKSPLARQQLIFFLVLFSLVGCAILRSSMATRLDSFTYDEAYHIGAGAAYVQTGDFRLNPEHPPLVKLWVVSSQGLQISPYRAYSDKDSERKRMPSQSEDEGLRSQQHWPAAFGGLLSRHAVPRPDTLANKEV